MESGLHRLVEDVPAERHEARRLALTATPVELEPQQWQQMLERIGADGADAGELARCGDKRGVPEEWG